MVKRKDEAHQLHMSASDTNMLQALIVAGVSLAIASLGWWSAKWLEDRRRRTESTLRRLGRQIDEFYGPLLGLTEQYIAVKNVQQMILSGGKESGKLTPDQRAEVRRFVFESYLTPIHDSMRKILDERLHLMSSSDMPESFRNYLLSSIQETIQYYLWSKRKIGTDFLPGLPFPQNLREEVRNELLTLLERQQGLLRAQLGGRKPNVNYPANNAPAPGGLRRR